MRGESPRGPAALYFAAAGILFLIAIATQFELYVPSRPVGAVAEIQALPQLQHSEGPLNVVFILIDTLRADRSSTYGYERQTTPVIDDLARYGVVFERVVSQSSWTKASMASLWTGMLPARSGIHHYDHVLPDEAVMAAELFQAAGYRTAGIYRNGWVAPNFGFAQGFDVYLRPAPGRDQILVRRQNPSRHPLRGSDMDLLLSAREFLARFGGERFFLYVHMMDLHQYVFDQDVVDFGPSYSDAYDKALNWTDRVVGRLVQEIDELGLLDRTLIAIAADHGEAFQEHGSEGHAKNLHAEVTNVPFVIAFPFRLDPGIRVRARIANVDIWPTLLELVGLGVLPEADGVSQVPRILEAAGASPETESLERPIFAQLERHWGRPSAPRRPLAAVTDGSLRLLADTTNRKADRLYDLSADPGETRNLADERPREAAALGALLGEYLESSEPPWGAEQPVVELQELELNQLRALGYRIGN